MGTCGDPMMIYLQSGVHKASSGQMYFDMSFKPCNNPREPSNPLKEATLASKVEI